VRYFGKYTLVISASSDIDEQIDFLLSQPNYSKVQPSIRFRCIWVSHGWKNRTETHSEWPPEFLIKGELDKKYFIKNFLSPMPKPKILKLDLNPLSPSTYDPLMQISSSLSLAAVFSGKQKNDYMVPTVVAMLRKRFPNLEIAAECENPDFVQHLHSAGANQVFNRRHALYRLTINELVESGIPNLMTNIFSKTSTEEVENGRLESLEVKNPLVYDPCDRMELIDKLFNSGSRIVAMYKRNAHSFLLEPINLCKPFSLNCGDFLIILALNPRSKQAFENEILTSLLATHKEMHGDR